VSTCSVCGSTALHELALRDGVPVLQNYVYEQRVQALEAPTGRLEIRFCEACGFAANLAFDANLLTYDQNYDNVVVSDRFSRYYADLSDQLYRRFQLSGKTVFEIGCGKATFLRTLVSRHRDVAGIGIDPSYEGALEDPELPIRFERAFFSGQQPPSDVGLIVCRHTLEHVPNPVPFLESIGASLESSRDVALFVEVPDLTWIVDSHTFWDFCYEHCNYFTRESLRHALEVAGFRVTDIYNTFGDQYLCAEATCVGAVERTKPGFPAADRFCTYAESEAHYFDQVAGRLQTLEGPLILWGMATKGVLYSHHLSALGVSFEFGVDQNRHKWDRFTPVLGLPIRAPESLASLRRACSVICMNPNYYGEVAERLCELNPDARLFGADGLPAPSD